MESIPSQTAPSQNDRLMAALSHITAILPVTGLVPPIVIWATQREKSEYVAFQALQAVVYQLSMVLAWFIGMALYMGTFFVAIPFSASSRGFPAFFFLPFAVMGLLLLGTFLFIVYAVVAAVMALQGRNFRYLIIGNALQHFLPQNIYRRTRRYICNHNSQVAWMQRCRWPMSGGKC